MSDLNRKTLEMLTRLCRIECSEAEQESLFQDLKKILNYIEQLDEVDTESVAPCNNVLEGLVNVMREDIVGETLSREDFLSNAPAHVGGMVKVPPVLKAGKGK